MGSAYTRRVHLICVFPQINICVPVASARSCSNGDTSSSYHCISATPRIDAHSTVLYGGAASRVPLRKKVSLKCRQKRQQTVENTKQRSRVLCWAWCAVCCRIRSRNTAAFAESETQGSREGARCCHPLADRVQGEGSPEVPVFACITGVCYPSHLSCVPL